MDFNYKMISAHNIARNGFAIVGISEKKALIGTFTTNRQAVINMDFGFCMEDIGDDILEVCPKQDFGYIRGNQTNDMMFPAILISAEDFLMFTLLFTHKVKGDYLEQAFFHTFCLN